MRKQEHLRPGSGNCLSLAGPSPGKKDEHLGDALSRYGGPSVKDSSPILGRQLKQVRVLLPGGLNLAAPGELGAGCKGSIAATRRRAEVVALKGRPHKFVPTDHAVVPHGCFCEPETAHTAPPLDCNCFKTCSFTTGGDWAYGQVCVHWFKEAHSRGGLSVMGKKDQSPKSGS